MTTTQDIVQAAIPGASEAEADSILWGRTPFPFATVTAKDLYRAASRVHRSTAKGIELCEFCNRIPEEDSVCVQCNTILQQQAKEQ